MTSKPPVRIKPLARASILLSLAALLAFACKDATPTAANMVGTWLAPGNSKLVLSGDSTFTIENLPGEIVIHGDESIRGVPCDGSGKWWLEYKDPYWEARLSVLNVKDKRFFREIPVEV